LVNIKSQKTKIMAKKAVKKETKKVAKKSAPKKSVKKVAKKATKKVSKKAPAKKVKRKANPALFKPVQPSPALAEIVGSKPIPRSQVVKNIWVYIKANKLQDTKNKRMINADAKLKVVFGGLNQVSMFEMAKHLSKHLK
jgi:chromatin remodeling complex protein RSC6